MTTDFRALCAEAFSLFDGYDNGERVDWDSWKERARAALADEPAVPEGREPVSVTGQPSDQQLLEVMPQQFHDDLATVSRMAAHGAGPDVGPGLFRVSLNTGVVDFARAVLARWGTPAPQPPAEGEVAELAEFLRACAGDHYGLGHHQFTRAADLLQRQCPQPVPVGERLPRPQDCDAEGRCWWHRYTPTPEWHLRFGRTGQHNHWLPAHALPVPEAES